MKYWTHYHTPQTIDEAMALLTRYAGQGRVIAGGTDLLVDARAEGEPAAEALIDITSIGDLRHIEQSEDGKIFIGAGVTHTQIVKSALLQVRATCLVESCGVVGGPQVRNVATLGGNVAHALPAGDGTVSLVELDAEVEVVKDGVRQWLPIREVYLGPGKSLLDSTRDLLVGFRFDPCSDGEATAFSRIMRPQGVALPILGCAVWIQLNQSRTTILDARVCIAPVAPTPIRAVEVERALIGQAADDDTVQKVAEYAQTTLHPRTSKYRATADYRQEMIAVLLKRTLTSSFERAQLPVS